MARKKNTKINLPRNGSARAASARRGGPMKHRLTPRGGARNKQAEYTKETLDD